MGFRLRMPPCLGLLLLLLFSRSCTADDESALLAVKAALGPTINLASWLPGTAICSWQGITCTNGRVTKLYLSGKDLGPAKYTGTISPAVGNLTELQSLDFSYNNMRGSLPKEIGNLKKLTELYLAFNRFSGQVPPELPDLPLAVSFTLDDNFLEGPIPSTIGNLKSVEYLDLTNNSFSGPIPASMGFLPKVTTIYLRKTNVSGSIPESFGNLASIQTLMLDRNQLTGSIPLSFDNLTDTLRTLDVSNNRLSGFISDGLLLLLNQPDPANPGTTRSVFTYQPQNTEDRFCSSTFPNLAPCPFRTPTAAPTPTPSSSTPSQTTPSPTTPQTLPPIALPDPEGSSSNTGVIVGVVVGVIVALGLVGGICCFLLVKQRKRKAKRPSVEESLAVSGMSAGSGGFTARSDEARAFSLFELAQATNKWRDVIGQGGYGPVYRGVLAGGAEVAIKRLGTTSKQGDHEFQAEVDLLRRLHFRRLVNLRGWCNEGGERMLVYEYKAMGSLDSHLFKSEKTPLTWDIRQQIAVDVALGLEYLHFGATPPVIHRDIKAGNVLLDKQFNAFVADFGLSRFNEGGDDEQVTAIKGTVGYLDPWYMRCSYLTTTCDVYSFGVLLLELISGRKAIDTKQDFPDRHVHSWAKQRLARGRLDEIVDPRLGGHYDRQQAQVVAEVGIACSEEDPEHRPNMRMVVRQLEGGSTSGGFQSPLRSPARTSGSTGSDLHGREVREVTTGDLYAPLNLSGLYASGTYTSTNISTSSAGVDFSELKPR